MTAPATLLRPNPRCEDVLRWLGPAADPYPLMCGLQAEFCIPAFGGGWWSFCPLHVKKGIGARPIADVRRELER